MLYKKWVYVKKMLTQVGTSFNKTWLKYLKIRIWYLFFEIFQRELLSSIQSPT